MNPEEFAINIFPETESGFSFESIDKVTQKYILTSMVHFANHQTASLREEYEDLTKTLTSSLENSQLKISRIEDENKVLREEIERLKKEKQELEINVLKEFLKDSEGIHPEYIREMLADQIEVLEKGV